MLGVMGIEGVGVCDAEFSGGYLQALVLEAGDDSASEASFHGVGLAEYKSAVHERQASDRLRNLDGFGDPKFLPPQIGVVQHLVPEPPVLRGHCNDHQHRYDEHGELGLGVDKSNKHCDHYNCTDSLPDTGRKRSAICSTAMDFNAEYEPSTWQWVADQVAEYEASGGQRANTLRETGIPIILFSTIGRKSGKVRKVPLMRVEHEGVYALVASKGGDPKHPGWFYNLEANPTIMMQDGPDPYETTVRLAEGDEYDLWWDRAVSVFGTYAEYKEKAGDRKIPVFLTEPRA